MANPKIETLIDSFTASAINTALWNSVTVGAATLDTVNDEVALAVPTASGGINVFGTNNLYDATGSSVYAQIGVAANGNGNTKTIMRVRLDSNNAMTLRVESGVFKQVNVTGGVSTTVTLPTYDPHQHRYWRLREAGGTFYADTSPDGLSWTQQSSMAYSWSATAVTFQVESQAGATEVAGNVSVIKHVNTRLGGQFNVNWPLSEDAWAPYWNANAGTVPLDRYVDVTNRTRGTVSVSRGRQYELDQVRSGEASLALANTDAALDPTNSSGPYAAHILPYQPYRKRVQWPATRNLLTQVQATGGDLGGYSAGAIPQGSAGIDVFSFTDTSGGTITASTTAWQGGNVLQFAVPSGTATQTAICYTQQPAVEPGVTYTLQMRVRNVTASTSQQVDAFIAFANVSGTLTTTRSSVTTLTGSTTAAWTLLTVTATAPADAARISAGVETGGTAAATCSVQVDGWQLERGSTATTWTAPGVWYPVYAGWTERWPSTWDMAGTYGKVQPTAVDTFSLLSQQQLSDPLTEEISSNSPRFVYKLDDPSGSTSVADWTGKNRAAQLAISKYGAGSLTFGNAITSTDANGGYTGSSSTVVTVNNASPGTNTVGAATFISLGSAGILGPADLSQWTRMIAFRYTGPTPANSAVFWSAFDRQRSGGNPSGSAMYWQIDSAGKIGLVLRGPTSGGTGTLFNPGPTAVDGDWHLIFAGYDRTSATLRLSIDGTVWTYTSVSPTLEPSGLVSDNVAAYVDPTVGNGTFLNYKGDISFTAEFPSQLSATAMINIYSAWKSACAGESSDARYARILRYAGYSGPSSLQSGLTTSMGPASSIAGQDAMTGLQSVVDTENGEHYIDRSGVVTFKARSARYNATTPVYVFGENTAAGEWPYEDCQLDYDSTHLSNQITVTQEGTSQNFYAADTTSIAAYFPRTLTRTINTNSTSECQDAANYLLSRYKSPATRVSAIKLHPSANPALWPVCLSLELGTRIRVMRRPPNVPAVQVDCFVEQLQVDLDDAGDAFWTLQCSPADLTPYGIFASFHTTLAVTITAGVSTVTINAGADSTNPAAAQIGQGQQLVLGLGTAAQETVTVLSVATTSPGWTTVAITLQAATTQAHTAGDIVCEPLPSGVTDATKYDSSAKFDAVNFAY